MTVALFAKPSLASRVARLFARGKQGAWYDPSDLTTLYQDAAGTTPVTAMEQPVGLMLDRSNGLVLGSELVTNGDFSNGATGWTAHNGTINATSGVLRIDQTTTAYALAYQAITCVIGKWYKLTITVVTPATGGSGSVQLGVGTSFTSVDATFLRNAAAAGTYDLYFAATATTMYVRPMVNITYDNVYAEIDNISVRELPGNHAFNPSGNSANFPVLSARYNLLTKTEDFSNAVWTKAGTSTAPSPNTLNFPALNEAIFQDFSTTATVGTAATFSVELSGSGTIYIGCYRSTGAAYEEDRLKITLTATPTRYSVSHTIINAGQNGFGGYISRAADGTATTVTANKAQLIHTNDALNQPAYQRVNTATDYDTVGFKPYLKFSGTNQWLQTNSIDFSYGDKMFVSAGVRKLSDAVAGILVESSTSIGTNTGAFYLTAPNSSSPTYTFNSKGTSTAAATATITAPISNVISGIGDISGDRSILRINGTQAAISTSDQGTGNYGNYPLYIGARAGSSLWFNGRLYGLVVAGKAATAGEISSTESYLNQRTGAY